MQADELTYQQALDEITMSTTLANKDRARLIIAELYGMEIPTELKEPTTPITEEEIEKHKRLTLEIPKFTTFPESTTALYQ